MIDAEHPLVSVVMPSLNQAAFLTEAIESVLDQDWPHLELLVSDGGSTDGSLDILQAMQGSDPRLQWVSEPDDGPAHALNKALQRVKGTIIGWLNADDRYTPGAVTRAVNALTHDNNLLMTYGEGRHIDDKGNDLGPYPTVPDVPPVEIFQDGCFICQPTVFFKRTLTVMLGPLDQRLGTAFDFDYWVRTFKAFRHRIVYLPAVQAHSRLHQDCITRNQRYTVALEGMQVLSRQLGAARGHWVLTYLEEALESRLENKSQRDLVEEMAGLLTQAQEMLAPTDLNEMKHKMLNRLHRAGIQQTQTIEEAVA